MALLARCFTVQLEAKSSIIIYCKKLIIYLQSARLQFFTKLLLLIELVFSRTPKTDSSYTQFTMLKAIELASIATIKRVIVAVIALLDSMNLAIATKRLTNVLNKIETITLEAFTAKTHIAGLTIVRTNIGTIEACLMILKEFLVALLFRNL